MAKDALGHGSNPRSGAIAVADYRAAHQMGVNRLHGPLAPTTMNTIKQNPDGFTQHALSGKTPTDGYMVAVPGRTKMLGPNDVTQKVVEDYTKRESALFNRPDTYLGGWHNKGDGKVYLDPSEHYHDAAKAIAAGRARNQIAIWDVKNKREINTGGDGK